MNVLVLAAHPDDETLGCGATLLRHKAQGDEVSWFISTSPNPFAFDKAAIKVKQAEVTKVGLAYGMTHVSQMTFHSGILTLGSMGNLIEGIRKAVKTSKAETVYVVWGGDVNTDHQVLYQATCSALKPFQAHGVRRLLAYETPSSTECTPFSDFRPTVYYNIHAFIDGKIEMMALYASEAQENSLPRGPRALRALARWRGATVGIEYAEAFMLLREVQ